MEAGPNAYAGLDARFALLPLGELLLRLLSWASSALLSLASGAGTLALRFGRPLTKSPVLVRRGLFLGAPRQAPVILGEQKGQKSIQPPPRAGQLCQLTAVPIRFRMSPPFPPPPPQYPLSTLGLARPLTPTFRFVHPPPNPLPPWSSSTWPTSALTCRTPPRHVSLSPPSPSQSSTSPSCSACRIRASSRPSLVGTTRGPIRNTHRRRRRTWPHGGSGWD